MTTTKGDRKWEIIKAPSDIDGCMDTYVGIRDTREEKQDYSLANAEYHVAQVFHNDDSAALLIAAAPSLLSALKTATQMIDWEAKCHDESGDPKRRRYVSSLRDAVRFFQAAIHQAEGL